MAKDMHDINLLPNRGDKWLIQFLNWTLNIGRLIIILVETLALGTFLYRFSLDWEIGELKDKIKIQRTIVASFKTYEDNFRNLQVRLDLIKKYDLDAQNSPKILRDILEMGKGYITFQNINISNNIIRIEAAAPTIAPLKLFMNSLKDYPLVRSVSIDKVEDKTSNSKIILSISANLKYD